MSHLIDEILVAEDVLEMLARWSDAALPNETGGILLGVLSDGRRWITTAREVQSTVSSRSRYEIPVGVTNALALDARRSDGRLGYLGDWHSHPTDAAPSSTDLGTYLRLLRLAFRRHQTAPVLVVLRRGQDGWRLHASSGTLALSTRQLSVTITGALPSAQEEIAG